MPEADPRNIDDTSFPLSKVFERRVDIPTWLKKLSAAQLLAQQQAFNEISFCATPNCQESKLSWCHVIPSRAQLDGISESGNVCWLPMRERDRWTLNPWWSEDSIAKTIVFRGFCNKCDASIFRRIDQPLALDPESFALLAYRAACYWNWRAEVDLRTAELIPLKTREITLGDHSLPPLPEDHEEALKPLIKNARDHRDAVCKMMASVRDQVLSSNFSFLESHVLDFRCDLPLRFSLAATFSLSLHYEHVDIRTHECPSTPALFIHLLNSGGSTKLILSWLKCVPDRYPNDWLTKFIYYSETGHLSDVLLRYMFIQNHGLVMRPSFASSLNCEQNAFLTAPLATRHYLDQTPQPTRICNPPYFDLNWKLYPV